MAGGIFSNRQFVAFLSGNAISLVGLWVQRIALGWLAWDLTRSEFWVGVIAFTEFFPVAVLGPLFGVLADRYDRRRTGLLVNSLMMGNAFALAIATGLFQPGIEVICLLAAINGSTAAAYTPVRLALLPNIVERRHLRSAVALGSVVFNVARFVGPALGGVIIALAGVSWAFAFNGITYLGILAALYAIRLSDNGAPVEQRRGLTAELASGARYTREHPVIIGFILLSFVSAFCGRSTLELMPAFAGGVFDRDSTGLAILTSAAGAGAIGAGLILSMDRSASRLHAMASAAAIGTGLVLLGLSVTDQFFWGVAATCLLGFTATTTGVGSQALIQTFVEDSYRGRVTSIWGMFNFGGPALGSALAGWLALEFGLQQVVGVLGVLCAGLALLLFLRNRHRVHRFATDFG